MHSLSRRSVLVGSVATAGCMTTGSNEAQPFSHALQRRLPVQPPFLAVFKRNEQVLGFVAARHGYDPQSPTFNAIRNAYRIIEPRAAIIEGVETRQGASPDFIVRQASKTSDNSASNEGEAVYTAKLALQAGIPFWGGEPTDSELYARLLADGFDPRDAFYAFLFGPLAQSIREGDFEGPSDPRFDTQVERWNRDITREMTSPQTPPRAHSELGIRNEWAS